MIYDSVSATCNSWSFHHDENSLAEDDNIDEVAHEEKKNKHMGNSATVIFIRLTKKQGILYF